MEVVVEFSVDFVGIKEKRGKLTGLEREVFGSTSRDLGDIVFGRSRDRQSGI